MIEDIGDRLLLNGKKIGETSPTRFGGKFLFCQSDLCNVAHASGMGEDIKTAVISAITGIDKQREALAQIKRDLLEILLT